MRTGLVRVLREWRHARLLNHSDLEFIADCAHSAYLRCQRPFVSKDLLSANVVAFREVVKARMGAKSGRGIEASQRYFVGNLQTQHGDFGARSLIEYVDKWLDALSDPPSCAQAEFASRNLFSYLEEELGDSPHLGSVLSPYLPALLQVAVRGYWYAERKPLVEPDPIRTPTFPVFPSAVTVGSVSVSPLVKDNELILSIAFKDRSLSLTANNYVEAEELREIVSRATQGRYFQGESFSLLENVGVKDSVVLFCSRVSQFLSLQEVSALSSLIERLAYVYGRI